MLYFSPLGFCQWLVGTMQCALIAQSAGVRRLSKAANAWMLSWQNSIAAAVIRYAATRLLWTWVLAIHCLCLASNQKPWLQILFAPCRKQSASNYLLYSFNRPVVNLIQSQLVLIFRFASPTSDIDPSPPPCLILMRLTDSKRLLVIR